jgi:DNA-binding transcriptional LysR family regulator
MEHNNWNDGRAEGLELGLLRHFVAVVESGSFTKAAARLNLSLSVASRSVSRLEDMLGFALLVRTTRSLQLTPAGEALFNETVASLGRISVAVDDARRIALGANASLRIGICQSVSDDAPLVQSGLTAFRAIWPHVILKLGSTISTAQPALLRSSGLDIGIMRFNRAACHDLEWHILSRSHMMVAVPATWRLRSKPLHLQDLADYPWILPDPQLSAVAHDATLTILRSAGFEPKIGGFADDRLTAQIMLGCGMGAALLHTRRDRVPTSDYDVIPIALPGPGSSAETIVAWAPSSTSEQIACLVRYLNEAAK